MRGWTLTSLSALFGRPAAASGDDTGDDTVGDWLEPAEAARAAGLNLVDLLAAVVAGEVRMTMTHPDRDGELLVEVSDVTRLAGLHRRAAEVLAHPDGAEPPTTSR